MSERFIKPTPRVDNIGMPVSAQDINVLQEIGVWTQQAAFRQDDESFKFRVLFTLEHNPLVNRGWLDMFSDTTFIDPTFNRLVHKPESRTLELADTDLTGVYYSKVMLPEQIRQIRFVLGLADTYLPTGCTVVWSITTNGQDWFPLNLGADPQPLPKFGTSLQVKAILSRASLDLYPQIRGISVLFEDYNTGLVTVGDTLKIVPPTNYDGPGPQQDGPGTGGTTEPGQGSLDGTLPPDQPIFAISHWELTDVHEDQHHPKNHRHNQNGIDPVHLDTDTVGQLPVAQLPSQVVLESEFITLLPADLVWTDELTVAINNLYERFKSEFLAQLKLKLPLTAPEDFPCFVSVRQVGDTLLERRVVDQKLVKVTGPRDTASLVYFTDGRLSHVVLACHDKASVDVLIRDVANTLTGVLTRDLTSLPGEAALAEAALLAASLQG